MAVNVAVTVGLGDTPAALNVITQVWLPTVALPAITEALTLPGVDPLLGLRLSQAQSAPREVLKFNPLAGLVLLTEMLCADGTVPPIV
jgi:hypothetical protein